MSRHPDPGFDPRIADWLEDDPDTAPPDLLRTVEGALSSIPQRRSLWTPWRSAPMNRVVLVAATAILVGVLGLGALAAGSRQPTPGPSAPPAAAATSPAAVASAEPSPTLDLQGPMAFYAAHDRICEEAAAADVPLRARYDRLWAASATPAERKDAIIALTAHANLGDDTTGRLLALDVPQDLFVEHVRATTRMEDITSLIRQELLLLAANRPVDAQAVDVATEPLARQVEAFENHYGLVRCP
jgi:hypothetical protein